MARAVFRQDTCGLGWLCTPADHAAIEECALREQHGAVRCRHCPYGWALGWGQPSREERDAAIAAALAEVPIG